MQALKAAQQFITLQSQDPVCAWVCFTCKSSRSVHLQATFVIAAHMVEMPTAHTRQSKRYVAPRGPVLLPLVRANAKLSPEPSHILKHKVLTRAGRRSIAEPGTHLH